MEAKEYKCPGCGNLVPQEDTSCRTCRPCCSRRATVYVAAVIRNAVDIFNGPRGSITFTLPFYCALCHSSIALDLGYYFAQVTTYVNGDIKCVIEKYDAGLRACQNASHMRKTGAYRITPVPDTLTDAEQADVAEVRQTMSRWINHTKRSVMMTHPHICKEYTATLTRVDIRRRLIGKRPEIKSFHTCQTCITTSLVSEDYILSRVFKREADCLPVGYFESYEHIAETDPIDGQIIIENAKLNKQGAFNSRTDAFGNDWV